MIPDCSHPNGEMDADRQKAMYIAIGVCPYCHGTLSEVRTDGKHYWKHCYACHFDFFVEDPS